MEDEEWEDVLLCSYLTPADKLGPKHMTDEQFERFVNNPNWAEVVCSHVGPDLPAERPSRENRTESCDPFADSRLENS